MSFELLRKEIDAGISGGQRFIPIGLERLGKYANIRKRILTLLFSSTGAGKSALLDTITLNACDDYMNSPTGKLKPDFQLFSMERSKVLRLAKWLSFLIFKNEGEIIELPKIMGWWKDKLSKEHYSLVMSYQSYIDQLLNDHVTIHEGAKTPNEIYRIMKDHFESLGKYEEIEIKGRKSKIYIANDPNIVVIPEIDHGNLIKTTQALPTKKQAIDKTVEYLQGFRDLEESAPIWVSQINRSIASVARIKDQEHELLLEDVKESSDIGDACDLAISLFDAAKYNQSSKTGYDPPDFIDRNTGENYFRSAQILKSSYGADQLRIPLAFNGFCGQFVELPKKRDLDDSQYQNIITEVLNKSYFLKNS